MHVQGWLRPGSRHLTPSSCVQLATTSTNVGALASARAILQEGGVSALFAGLGPAIARVIPMAIVSFGTYEWVRLQFMKVEEAIEVQAARFEACTLPSCELSVRV
jgi:Mitochondrial carrier protein